MKQGSSLQAAIGELIANPPRVTGTKCGVRVLLDLLEKDDGAALLLAISTLAIPATALAKALADQGHHLHYSVIARHRRGDCRCKKG